MGITAQRLWRQKHAAKAAPAAPPPKETYTRTEVQEIQRAYEIELAKGGRGEARKLIDDARERFSAWAEEVREEARRDRETLAKQLDDTREELERTKTTLEQVARHRDELAELVEQSTTPKEGAEGGTGGAETAPTTGNAPPAAEGAQAQPGDAPSAETTAPATESEATPPAEAGKAPRGKGGRGSR